MSSQKKSAIDKITKKSAEERAVLLRYFLDKIPENHKPKVFELQSKIFKICRQEFASTEATPGERSYAALCLAVQKYFNNEQAIHRRATPTDLRDLQQLQLDRILLNKIPRKSPQRKFIKINFEMIKGLRDKKISWRNIADFIRINRKKNISAVYLMNTYKELLDDRKHFDRLTALHENIDAPED